MQFSLAMQSSCTFHLTLIIRHDLIQRQNNKITGFATFILFYFGRAYPYVSGIKIKYRKKHFYFTFISHQRAVK